MENFDYSILNLKNLRVLKAVYELGSVTAAAAELGMTQPTLSYNLDQLREILSDPLFVRSGRGVVPTERCRRLMPEVENLSRGLFELLQAEHFSPHDAQMRTTISCNQYELNVIAPALIQRLNALAPRLQIQIIQAHLMGQQQLQRGKCDLLLSPVEGHYEGLYQRALFREHYVCVMSAQHPLAGTSLDLDRYIAAKHVDVGFEGDWKPLYLQTPELKGVNINIALRLPSLANIGAIIQNTDLMLTMPRRYAALLGDDVVIKTAPFDSQFTLNLFWNRTTHQSQAYQWIRQQIMAVCAEIDAR